MVSPVASVEPIICGPIFAMCSERMIDPIMSESQLPLVALSAKDVGREPGIQVSVNLDVVKFF
jgi:hypothetical protein